ncbi:MAG TPA: HDOD domain-containing protein [Gemmataceae bacterium]|nr:HDOD domain-containing protein [Gemmataceae bacterium]
MSLTLDHNEVMRAANGLPPLPQSAMRLTTLLANEEADFREVVKVIEYDPSLTLKLLKIANSAFGGGGPRIGNIHQALVRLGTGTVAGFVISACVRTLIGERIPGYGIPEKDFWTHSLAAAFAAEAIQARSTKWHGNLAFTAGLLHDIGKLILGRFLDADARSWLERACEDGHQPAFRAEREILSMHHGEVGGLIAQHWELPDCLVKGIIFHHAPDEGDDGICHVTHLANEIAHEVAAEERAKKPTLSPRSTRNLDTTIAVLGLSARDIEPIRQEARRSLQAVASEVN